MIAAPAVAKSFLSLKSSSEVPPLQLPPPALLAWSGSMVRHTLHTVALSAQPVSAAAAIRSRSSAARGPDPTIDPRLALEGAPKSREPSGAHGPDESPARRPHFFFRPGAGLHLSIPQSRS